MTLAIIMPARNEARFIAMAIASVLADADEAALVPVTVLVVDDGSTDETAAIVARMAHDDPRIRLIPGAREGAGPARNRALAVLPRGTTLIGFLDADDVWPKGRLAADLALIAADPELQLVYGRMRLVESETPDLATVLTQEDVIQLGVSLSAGIFRATCLLANGGFDPAFVQSEDFDFLLRLFETKPKAVITDRVMVLYRRHPGNSTANKPQMRHFFLRALMEHAKRRRQDPALPGVEWVWGGGFGRTSGDTEPAMPVRGAAR
ncbi:MAG: glycosyltransferase family 2 protein [Rubellimicrobium sp.]|nr:glycosyltransferase family 2 protein [Rubellimicrobium sp.]